MTPAVGRPKGDSGARARLIAAALNLFGSRGYHTVSTRELAHEASVDASLIRYYFGSKAGLFEQMVRETLAPVRKRFEALSRSSAPGQIADLMQTYYRAVGATPGLPRLVFRVLQEGEGSEPYRIVLAIFQDLLRVSRHWLGKSLVESGALREEVDPDFARLSLVSLMVFPLIAPPVLMQQFGISIAPENLVRLAAHNAAVWQQGLLRGEDNK